jgi:hypothetical protein
LIDFRAIALTDRNNQESLLKRLNRKHDKKHTRQKAQGEQIALFLA